MNTSFMQFYDIICNHLITLSYSIGSTAEIVRILGGPAVGDIRSRLLGLAPGTTREARAVRRLLGHRLISNVEDDDNVDEATISRMAREEWLDILDGGQESYQSANTRVDDDDKRSYEHPLWKDVSAPYRSVSSSTVCFYITTRPVKDTNYILYYIPQNATDHTSISCALS